MTGGREGGKGAGGEASRSFPSSRPSWCATQSLSEPRAGMRVGGGWVGGWVAKRLLGRLARKRGARMAREPARHPRRRPRWSRRCGASSRRRGAPIRARDETGGAAGSGPPRREFGDRKGSGRLLRARISWTIGLWVVGLSIGVLVRVDGEGVPILRCHRDDKVRRAVLTGRRRGPHASQSGSSFERALFLREVSEGGRRRAHRAGRRQPVPRSLHPCSIDVKHDGRSCVSLWTRRREPLVSRNRHGPSPRAHPQARCQAFVRRFRGVARSELVQCLTRRVQRGEARTRIAQRIRGDFAP